VAFITGASRGIGKASAIALAAKGFDVVVTARTLEEGEAFEHGAHHSEVKPMPGSLRATAAEIEKLGRRALPIRLDLLDLASIDAAVDRVLAEWGRIDLLLNNGIYQGPGVMSPLDELTQQNLHDIFRGNVFANVHTIQRVLPRMLEQGGGCIINVVSESGMIDPPAPVGKGGWGFAYGASKAALINFTEALYLDLHPRGIGVYLVNPGFVDTPMTEGNPFPMPFLMPVDEAAARIIRGLEKRRFEVAFPWQVVTMLKLARLAPEIVEDIARGRQPVGLSLLFFVENPLPDDWNEQRDVIGGLAK